MTTESLNIIENAVTRTFREVDILGTFPSILYKGDNFCDFLFAFLHTNLFLKRALL